MADSRLNTKTKRIGALVMCAGLGVSLFAALQFRSVNEVLSTFEHNPITRFQQISGYHNGLARFSLWLGIIVAGLGLLWSYLYDHTIAKVARWIETGSARASHTKGSVPAAPLHPARPAEPPRPLTRTRTIARLAVQSWLTIIASIGIGLMFIAEGKREMAFMPAFVACLFIMQAWFHAPDDMPDGAFNIIAVSKLGFAYVGFAIGVLAALAARSF